MSNKYFGAIALTGGGTGAVDAIAVALLSEGDILKVVSDTYEYAYNYSASEAGSEDSPRIIIPDDNVSGTGAWVLRGATPFYLQGKGGDIASASPLVIDTDGDYFDVTGTTGFAAMTVVANRHFFLQFDGALVMTHHATNLDLPGEANITTVAGDVAEFFSTGSNTVQCVNYTRADGTAIDSGSVATDAIWDAAGDFAVGTGANTAARLAAGATTEVLVGGGAAAPVWTTATGTGAPVRAGSPTFTTQITTPIIALTGGQIAFPATAVPSADANTLDDYEEGTWTLTVSFGGASVGITYGNNTMYYTKIGRLVHVQGILQMSSKGTSVGNSLFSGLPFTAGNYAALSIDASALTFANQALFRLNGGATTFDPAEMTEAGVWTNLTNADFANNTQIIFSGCYYI